MAYPTTDDEHKQSYIHPNSPPVVLATLHMPPCTTANNAIIYLLALGSGPLAALDLPREPCEEATGDHHTADDGDCGRAQKGNT